MRIALSLVLAATFAMCGVTVSAEPATTFASLTVNGTDLGDALVALDAPGVALELTSAQQNIPDFTAAAAAGELTLDGRTFVRLDALAPRVRYTWDDATVHLSLVVIRAGRQNLDLSAQTQRHDLAPTHGAYVNYDVLGTSNFGLRGTLDGNAAAGSGFFHVSASVAPQLDIPNAYFEIDNPNQGRRYQAGATQTVGDALFSSASIVGFTTRHDDGVEPFAMDQARPMFTGIADSPSIADVYVNGHLVRSVPVAPGAFSLNNIPADGQTGNVDVVLRNSAGAVQHFDAPYAIDTSLLRTGATEDSAAVGRDDSGTMLFDGTYRRGLNDRTTIDAHIGGSGRDIAASAGASIMFMPVTAHFALASVNGAAAGYDASLAIPTHGGSLSVGLMQRSVPLAGMSSIDTLGVETRRLSLQFAQRLSPSVDMFASVDGSTYTTSGVSRSANAGIRIRTAPAAFASVYLENQRGDSFAPHTSIALSFTTSLSRGRSLSANTAPGSAGVEVQQAPKGPLGLSYDIRSGLTEQRVMAMEQTGAGTFSGTFDRAAGTLNETLDASGGIAFAGGHIGFTAPIAESFALVSLPGVAHAPIYVDQQLAGYTDASGNLFVNNLRRFASTNISVGYDALPLDVELDRPNIVLTPKSRGGAVARFNVHRVRSIAGTVIDETGNPPPAYALMTLESATQHTETRLDEIGGFAVDDIAPGTYRFAVTLKARSCFGTLHVPAGQSVRNDLGRLACSSKVAQR